MTAPTFTPAEVRIEFKDGTEAALVATAAPWDWRGFLCVRTGVDISYYPLTNIERFVMGAAK